MSSDPLLPPPPLSSSSPKPPPLLLPLYSESGRYYNSYRDSNGGMTPPKISIADSGYVVYEILVRANFDNAMAWTCHRRYKNFLELEESLPPPSSVELSGCVWDDEEDEEFDYKKGVRTNTIAEEVRMMGQNNESSCTTTPLTQVLPPRAPLLALSPRCRAKERRAKIHTRQGQPYHRRS